MGFSIFGIPHREAQPRQLALSSSFMDSENPSNPITKPLSGMRMPFCVLAALGVFGTGSAWPDVAVAALMAALALRGGWQVWRQAHGELTGIVPL